ncbi:hypothetical protein ACOKFD_17300 [Flagellimonas sp. S174]|uniref:hypothetical protein n=1 Tax=Flagellimonas sp. S174 TaxID=3410790 RepID=UPI003BF54B6F
MVSKKQLDSLTHLIEDIYGTPEVLAQKLDLTVEMLFYLEDNAFTKREVQNVVAALRDVVGVLRR